MESRLGRMRARVTGRLALALGPGERLKTPEFLAIECRLATLNPHAQCNDVLNLACRRSAANGDLVKHYTEYEDVLREGARAEAALASAVRDSLGSRGVTLTDEGAVDDHSAIDGVVGAEDAGMLRYDPSADPEGLTEAELGLRGFVERYNAGKDDPRKRISGPFEVEADPGKVAYVSVDDVLTRRQARSREAGGPPGEWIFHSVAHVQADDASCVLESRSQAACYAGVLACLLGNGLEGRRIVLLTDGEETLKTIADDVFSGWTHSSYLDFYHVRENLSGRFSRIFRPGKVVDETVEPQRFKNGRVKKSSIAKITRSQLHLRETLSMIWPGNVDGAIDYLRNVDPSELKRGGERELAAAIEYLERKRDRIPCYAARRHLGLRNSSNAVERANNALVSKRQKKKGLSWSDDGSFALGTLTAAFVGGLSEGLFRDGTWSLEMRRGSAGSRLSRVGVDWIVGLEADLTVTPGKGWVVPERAA